MSLPVFSTERHRISLFGVTAGQRLVSAALLFCIAVGAGVALGRIGTDPQYPLNPLALQQNTESEEVAAIRQKAEHQIAALTARVASLQAQVNRLNMVGERLIDASNLSKEEFNFDQLPPIGGPMQTSTEAALGDLNQMLIQMTDLNHNIGMNSELSGRPVTSGYISSNFGIRSDPFNGKPTQHLGLDFAGDVGDPVYATAGGIVTWAGEKSGYGEMVEIEHPGGYRTRYGHSDRIDVVVGQMVNKGQQVATIGNSGRSTGPHVHYEVLKNGRQVDPISFVNIRQNKFNGTAKTATQSQH
jgi:murein DD-endopeptidase MepM/ murein hydrolase activator NlpD